MGSPEDEPERVADEGPLHAVAHSQPLYVGIYPVTQIEYETVMVRNPAQFTKGQGGGPQHPVEQVSWDDAVEFCRRLSLLRPERQAGLSYRLPTEAEWEFFCRAGTTTPFCIGALISSAQANFDGTHPYGWSRPGPHKQRTTKVGSYPANRWGLHDVHGNVWEWCADWYAATYARAPQTDPPGPAHGDRRVLRGGSWNNSGHLCRSARRNKHSPEFRNDSIGFRVVVEVSWS